MGNNESSLKEKENSAWSHQGGGGKSEREGRRRPAPTKLSSPAASTAHAHAAHSRSRATTGSAPITMGNAESKDTNADRRRPSSRSSTLNTPPVIARRQASPLSRPVNVPAPSSHDGPTERETSTPPTSPFAMPASVFTRPPRLPLPIDDPQPASPIIDPQELDVSQLEDSTEVDLPKRESLLSQTTLGDDEDGADIQQFAMETDPLAPKIPFTMTWQGEGTAVYVTGTFSNWEKKFRMAKDRSGVFSTTIPLPPGTHHITFLVDGDPKTSRDLPTTVDFANALVNYIEVVAPQSPTAERQPAAPLPIPGATAESGGGGTRPVAIRSERLPETGETTTSTLHETIVPPPNQPSLRPHSIPDVLPLTTPTQQPPPPKPKPRQPRPKYSSTIPEILLHLDLYATPEDERYRRATKATLHLPQPPSLPMFMSKSILNATTPQKDDASVLTMPNHTVLNHLATSSIRNGVLATSGTTRYKRKFLTTIMYKPTSEDG